MRDICTSMYPVYCIFWESCGTLSFSFFSERELTFTFATCCRPSVCLSSVVGNARAPSQAVEIFGNISMALGTLAIC